MRIWVQLAEKFGKAFYRENDQTPPKLWRQAFSKLTDKQVANGLADLGNQALAFPPNLSQFIAACKREKPSPPYWNALPPPDYDKDAEAEKAWADMERLAGRSLR